MSIDKHAIPIRPETAAICAALDVDPLGLIGSGSLLITCTGDHADDLIDSLAAAGVNSVRIGEVLDTAPGVGPEDWSLS